MVRVCCIDPRLNVERLALPVLSEGWSSDVRRLAPQTLCLRTEAVRALAVAGTPRRWLADKAFKCGSLPGRRWANPHISILFVNAGRKQEQGAWLGSAPPTLPT